MTVNDSGTPSFNGRLYAIDDLAKALQRKEYLGRPVELVGRDDVTQQQMKTVMAGLARHGIYNVTIVMPRRKVSYVTP